MPSITEIDVSTRAAVDAIIRDEWSGPFIVTLGNLTDTSQNPGFVCTENGIVKGFITYMLRGAECEITVLTVPDEGRGIGTKLIERVINIAKATGCTRVWLVTTNDNTHAIRFYQKRGFSLAAVHINSLDAARKLKPGIPPVGIDGIPLRHEFEFEIML